MSVEAFPIALFIDLTWYFVEISNMLVGYIYFCMYSVSSIVGFPNLRYLEHLPPEMRAGIHERACSFLLV